MWVGGQAGGWLGEWEGLPEGWGKCGGRHSSSSGGGVYMRMIIRIMPSVSLTVTEAEGKGVRVQPVK